MSGRRGLTLIELVIATGLLSVLMLAVFTLLDGSLSLWKRAELRRSITEQGSAVMDLLAGDLRALEPGELGDVVVDWVRFDTNGDGVGDRGWPRLRMVRQASVAELAQHATGGETPLGPALVEVCWSVTPSAGDADAKMEGVLWRGERLLTDRASLSFFDPGFFGRDHRAPPGALDEVTGGILWLQPLLATQTSIVYDGWKIGRDLDDAATSWDAWEHGRPDSTTIAWNEPGAGMPKAGARPLLPRRVRLELELERPIDRRSRTRTTSAMEANDLTFGVDDPERLPLGGERYVLIDGEWMRITGVSGRRVTVQRGQRDSLARPHEAGRMVHWGLGMVREVPVDLYREDWNL